MELCGNGALRECLKLNLPWQLRVRIALEVAQGIEFLHSNGIIHRYDEFVTIHYSLVEFILITHSHHTTYRVLQLLFYGVDQGHQNNECPRRRRMAREAV
jgi:hypothetical protein